MPERGGAVVRPKLHHVNLKTTRLQEMIDWYGRVVGAEATFGLVAGSAKQRRPRDVAPPGG